MNFFSALFLSTSRTNECPACTGVHRVIVLASTILLAGFMACGPADTKVSDLTALYEEAWAYQKNPRPLDTAAIEDDPRLPDMRVKAIAHRGTYWQSVLDRLDAVDAGSLSGQDKINYEVFRYITEDKVAEHTHRAYLMPFTAEGGFHTGFGFQAGRTLETQKQFEDYLVKLEGFGTLIDEQLELMRTAIAEDMMPPCVIMEGFDGTVQPYISDIPEESVFFRPFREIPAAIADGDQMRQRALSAIEDIVTPAYRRLEDFLREAYIPACRASTGATELPGGVEYYDQRVRHFTTLDLTANEVFIMGMEEVTRIREEMEAIIDSLGFRGSFAEFLRYLRTDPKFYAATPRQLLAEASYFSKRIDGLLPRYFGRIPRLPYGVAAVPDEIAPRYTAGRYVPGSAKDRRSGTYWVNTYNLPGRPLYALPALTLHEAMPGHHFQIALAEELDAEAETSLPEFRKNYYISAFGEGWALYTEWLGHEMGIYEDLYQKFGALTYEMWRACRLVVDPGLHAKGWTREQAVNFLAENTALSLHEVNTEIDRYIGWPGQALSYKLGELTIRALRREAEDAHGDRFDLRTFHDKVLENGSVPLFVLERVVREWIREAISH